MSGKAAVPTLLCLKEGFFFFFKVAEPPCGRLFMLGREGLQLHYLSLFPNVTGVANLNCLIAFGFGEC